MSDLAIGVNQLDFSYAQLHGVQARPVLEQVTLNLPKGSRCLLVGSNGAGTSFSLTRSRQKSEPPLTVLPFASSPHPLPGGTTPCANAITPPGKSTLLQILAGKRLTRSNAQVLGQNVFFQTPPGVTYLGASSCLSIGRAGVAPGKHLTDSLRYATCLSNDHRPSIRHGMGRQPRREKRPRGFPFPVSSPRVFSDPAVT